MDLITTASGIAGLVFTLARVLKGANDIYTRYRDAPRTLSSIAHELETLQAALRELAGLMMRDADALAGRWDDGKGEMARTFERAIKGLERTVRSLEGDLGIQRGRRKRRPSEDLRGRGRAMIEIVGEEGEDERRSLVREKRKMGKREKGKVLWNEDAMKEHLGQLRAQASAMQLLLLVLHT